jgi:hypothetical protein
MSHQHQSRLFICDASLVVQRDECFGGVTGRTTIPLVIDILF